MIDDPEKQSQRTPIFTWKPFREKTTGRGEIHQVEREVRWRRENLVADI